MKNETMKREPRKRRIAKLRAAIRLQKEVVHRKSCDIPTWGGRSFHVDYQQACEELKSLERKLAKLKAVHP